ncbi:glycosyltransferase family 39 protein [Candidatus Sumerlaeota bacterium]|nr:glycosyltransferase family 39 protein [Candidatus Sumerlaeota bacterium]
MNAFSVGGDATVDEISSSPSPGLGGTSRALWIILIFALALRLGLFIGARVATGEWDSFYQADSPSYLQPAREMVEHGTFTTHGKPEVLRTPGYPLLMVPGVLLGHPEAVTVTLQAFLSVLTVFLVYRIALSLTGRPRVALLAALLCAIEPVSILYVSQLMSETFFTALMTLSLLILLRHLAAPSLARAVLLAVALASATYVRPISLYLPFAFGLGLAVHALTQAGRRRALLIHALVFFVLSMGFLWGWKWRNTHEAGVNRFSGIEAINLYFYNAASIFAAREGISYREMQQRWGHPSSVDDENSWERAHPEQADWSTAQRLDFMESEGKRLILENLGEYLKIHIRGTIRVLTSRGGKEWYRLFGALPPDRGQGEESYTEGGVVAGALRALRERPFFLLLTLTLIGISGLLYLLAFIGLFSRLFVDRWQLATLVLTLLYFLAVCGGPIATIRFRLPLVPGLAVLAGAGLALVLSRLTRFNSEEGARAAPE